MKPPGELWVIALRPLPDDVPVRSRVNALLKAAKRLGLKAVSMRDASEAERAWWAEWWETANADIRAIFKEAP